MGDATATGPGWQPNTHDTSAHCFGLLIAWSVSEPGRIGDIAFFEQDTPRYLGRGEPSPGDTSPRVAWFQQRPGVLLPRPALASAALSRRQLLIRPTREGLEIKRVGRLPMKFRGEPLEQRTLSPGDSLLLGHELLLSCVRRELGVLRPRGPAPGFEPGQPDPQGIVGESPRAWLLRGELAFFAQRPQHVLVVGPSGVGKELAARALHQLSPRARRPFIARSAATLPSGLIDAELFGSAKNYPQAAMHERPGLIGEADGGTLFLDEIGELPESLQAHLLRFLDSGEYHRLGESTPRRADVRLVAATNRDPGALKHDLFARLKLLVEIPGLGERREDIPLLVRALLRRFEASDPGLLAHLRDGRGHDVRVDPELIEAFLRHRWVTHTRELESLLLLAITKSRGGFLGLTTEVRARLNLEAPEPPPRALDEAAVSEALQRNGGSVSRAARDLGLSDRNALYRLMKKFGLPSGA